MNKINVYVFRYRFICLIKKDVQISTNNFDDNICQSEFYNCFVLEDLML